MNYYIATLFVFFFFLMIRRPPRSPLFPPRRSSDPPVPSPLGGRSGFLRLPLRLPGGLAGFSDPRTALRLGVAPGYPATLATLRAVRERLTGRHGPWPGAQDLVRELVTLPTHSLVGTEERQTLLRSWSSTARQLMIPRGAAAGQHRQFACRLVRQAPNWCL